MPRKKQEPQIKITDEQVDVDSQASQKKAKKPEGGVTFTPEQLELVQQMIAQSKETSQKDSSISVYGARDPREITHVKVSMFEGKFVVGFKDFQNNPFSKEKKLYQEKTIPERGLTRQPFVTLILTDTEGELEEMEVALVDYMNYRSKVELPIEKMIRNEVIKDHGVLGKVGAGTAIGVDSEGKALSKLSLKAESKEIKTSFYVKLPGFKNAIEFTEDVLA